MVGVTAGVPKRPVHFRQVPGEAFGEAYGETMVRYGMSEGFAQGLVDMVAARNEGIYDAERRTSQPGSTGFRRWCEDALEPAVLT